MTLTAREREVLELLADGASTLEVAAELHVKVTTAQAYIDATGRTLGARNRCHAVALAYHHGLLTPARHAA